MNAFRPTSVSRACVLLMSISGENTEGGNGMPGNIVDMILVWWGTCVCLAYKCVCVFVCGHYSGQNWSTARPTKAAAPHTQRHLTCGGVGGSRLQSGGDGDSLAAAVFGALQALLADDDVADDDAADAAKRGGGSNSTGLTVLGLRGRSIGIAII